jgi:hypothetical protein
MQVTCLSRLTCCGCLSCCGHTDDDCEAGRRVRLAAVNKTAVPNQIKMVVSLALMSLLLCRHISSATAVPYAPTSMPPPPAQLSTSRGGYKLHIGQKQDAPLRAPHPPKHHDRDCCDVVRGPRTRCQHRRSRRGSRSKRAAKSIRTPRSMFFVSQRTKSHITFETEFLLFTSNTRNTVARLEPGRTGCGRVLTLKTAFE